MGPSVRTSAQANRAVQYLKSHLPGPVRSWLLRLRRRFQTQISESGEVETLRRLIRPTDLPFLVDVGANDGLFFSNSYEFLKAGWSGLLIEPLPKAYRSLARRYRRSSKVTCLNVACSNQSGQGQLFIGADGEMGMTSTLSKDQNDWFLRNRTSKTIPVQVRVLNDVLKEANVPKDFSLLMIDTEGLDFEVLQGIQFAEYRPRIILTENYDIDLEKAHAKDAFLIANGYELAEKTLENSFWIRKS